MRIGMMWTDSDPKRTTPDKIIRACSYYANKYGGTATVCYVHPDSDCPERLGGVRVMRSRTVLPDHFWIGVEE